MRVEAATLPQSPGRCCGLSYPLKPWLPPGPRLSSLGMTTPRDVLPGSGVRVEGKWEPRGVLSLSISPTSVLTPCMGLERAAQGSCVKEELGRLSFLLNAKVHCQLCAQCTHSVYGFTSPPPQFPVDSVLPLRHLRAKDCGPQERISEIKRPSEDSHFPGKFKYSR